jgi:hypothetical protein
VQTTCQNSGGETRVVGGDGIYEREQPSLVAQRVFSLSDRAELAEVNAEDMTLRA